MKQITDNSLRQLKPRERAFLALEAMSRRDEAEVERLRDTCPQVNYMALEHEYTAYINRFFELALTLECEGRGQVAKLLSIMPHRYESEALALDVLTKVAEIKATALAWREWCDAEGIHPVDVYQTVTGEPSLWLQWADKLESMATQADQATKANTLVSLRQICPR